MAWLVGTTGTERRRPLTRIIEEHKGHYIALFEGGRFDGRFGSRQGGFSGFGGLFRCLGRGHRLPPQQLLVPGGRTTEGFPGPVRDAGPAAQKRLVEFFTAEISNPNTRVGAMVSMSVENYYQQDKRWWLRLHEQGGRFHQDPAHNNAEVFLDANLEATGIGEEKGTPLWRSMTITGCRLSKQSGAARFTLPARSSGNRWEPPSPPLPASRWPRSGPRRPAGNAPGR